MDIYTAHKKWQITFSLCISGIFRALSTCPMGGLGLYFLYTFHLSCNFSLSSLLSPACGLQASCLSHELCTASGYSQQKHQCFSFFTTIWGWKEIRVPNHSLMRTLYFCSKFPEHCPLKELICTTISGKCREKPAGFLVEHLTFY